MFLSKNLFSLLLLLASHEEAKATFKRPSSRSPRSSSLRRKLADFPPEHVWGFQSGPGNGHSDAGGIEYNWEKNELILVGTTHDNQFYADNAAVSVDCFIGTISLPPSQEEKANNEVAVATANRTKWTLSGKKRVATPETLDRCDLVTFVAGTPWGDGNHHDHIFVAGTVATDVNDNKKPKAVHPQLYEVTMDTIELPGYGAEIEAGPPLMVFEDASQNDPATSPPEAEHETKQKSDLIIPAAMASKDHYLFLATVHRLYEPTPNPPPLSRIGLGIAKFAVTDSTDNPLQQEYSRIYMTNILENKKQNDVPAFTSALFSANPGLSPTAQAELENEQEQIQQEVEQIEQEEAEYEAEEMQAEYHRHNYRNDGVLISGLEFVDTENPDEAYLLVAGSAPGSAMGNNNNGNNNTRPSTHPYMDDSSTFAGDWDGYVSKIDSKTGDIMVPQVQDQNQVHNTWTYRLKTQPKRNDFIQSLCLPKLPPSIEIPAGFYPSVAYGVGTTQGKFDGDTFGGAFLFQLDLDTMNILWKMQIPGMNVHGMACKVLLDLDTLGETTRANSNDLIYIAGEVHGNMKVNLEPRNGTPEQIETLAHGETDVWVAQVQAANGKINWVQQIGTEKQDRLAKNVNNPQVSVGEEQTTVGDTGSGAGALTIDREGHAIVYGTTNGALARDKSTGNNLRDIFVVRLHKEDGSFQSIMPPQNILNEGSSTPVGSSSGSSTSSSNGGSSTSSATSTSSSRPAQTSQSQPQHQSSMSADTPVMIIGLLIPVVLWGIIYVATGKRSDPPPPFPVEEPADLHVPFPSSQPQYGQEQPIQREVELETIPATPRAAE